MLFFVVVFFLGGGGEFVRFGCCCCLGFRDRANVMCTRLINILLHYSILLVHSHRDLCELKVVAGRRPAGKAAAAAAAHP